MSRRLPVPIVITLLVATSFVRSFNAAQAPVKVPAPTPGGRIQLDRWVDTELGISDPLTQIVRVMHEGNSGHGTGFLLPNCRVMTVAHVIAAGANLASRSADEDIGRMTFDTTELVGERYNFETQPLAALNGGRATGQFVVLAHGATGSGVYGDWAIGLDDDCLAEKLHLGTIDISWMAPQKAPASTLEDAFEEAVLRLRAARPMFTAGYSIVEVPGIAKDGHPLYIDSKCRVVSTGSEETDRENFNRRRAIATDCSGFQGGSGQPLLAPVIANGRVVRDAEGRPQLEALGLLSKGTDPSLVDDPLKGRQFFMAFTYDALKDLRGALYEMSGLQLDAIRKMAAARDRARRTRLALKDRGINGQFPTTASAEAERAIGECFRPEGERSLPFCESALERADLTRHAAAEVLIWRARILLDGHHFGDALREVNVALDRYPEPPIGDDDPFLRIELHDLRGDILREASLLSDAQREYARAIAILDDSATKLPDGLRSRWSWLLLKQGGFSAAERHDYITAFDAYDALVDLAPSAEAFWGRCWALAALADRPGEPADALTRALDDCNRALEMRPGAPELFEIRAFVHLKMERYPEALRDYNAALANNPGLAESRLGRGIVKLRTGDSAGAEADFSAATAMDPKIEADFERRGVTRLPLTAADAVKAIERVDQLLKGRRVLTPFYIWTNDAVELSGVSLNVSLTLAEIDKPDDSAKFKLSMPLTAVMADLSVKQFLWNETADIFLACAGPILPGQLLPPSCITESSESTRKTFTKDLLVPAETAEEIATLLRRAILAASISARKTAK